MNTVCTVEGCDRPTQGTICTHCQHIIVRCLTKLATGPRTIRGTIEPGLIADLDDVVARLMRSGLASGVASRSANTPLPYHEVASDLLFTVRHTLHVWGADFLSRDATPPRGSAAAAKWLAREVANNCIFTEYHAMYDEITWLTAQVESMVDIAPLRVYLGVCGGECRSPLYALPGHTSVRCKQCGSVYSVEVRRGQLLTDAQDMIAPAADIARALSLVGRPVTLARIGMWVKRGRLVPHDAHPFDPRRRHRYRLGDVVSLTLPKPPKRAIDTQRVNRVN